MATVIVTFDPNVKPQFTFTPDTVTIKPGTDTIQWTRANANFTFAALAFDHQNPFSNVIVHDDEITADDDNRHAERHIYMVLIKANGAYYNSKDSHALGSGPTIKNN